MKILITGSSGFIGKNVKKYLEEHHVSYKLFAPSSKELNCLNEKDVTSYLKQHYFDKILHFAVYGDAIDKSKDRSKVLEYNLRMFYNFAKNTGLYGEMYYTGSGAEYNKSYEISKVTEEEIGKTIPVDQYGLMKYTIGKMIENSKNIYNLRLFGIFGKYEYYPQKFISNICCKAIMNLPLTIRQNVYFDYLWIDDFCKILDFFLCHKPQYHTYNIVSGQAISLKEICQLVIKISGKNLPIYIGKEGLANEYTASNKRLVKEYSELKFTSYEEAVQKLYNWYKENREIDIYQLLY